MWPVDHAPVETHDARRRRRGEGRDHSLRMLALGVGRRKRSVDRGNLIRVNGELAAESVAARGVELVLQSQWIAKVSTHTIDGLRPERRGRQQAVSARELKGESQRARVIALCQRSEGCAEILSTPGEPGDPLAQTADSAERGRILRQCQDCGGRLGGDDEQPRVARPNPEAALEPGELAGYGADLRRR